ncbi:MAG TPA: hypothetical protein VLY85_01490 [Thermoplasmata archaeon]|nr:hypothetical protein [Thermoplasmata archaeon]
MTLFWGVSRRDRDHFVQALHELGPSSVPALAAALSWKDRKVERVAAELARTPGSGVLVDAGLRNVRMAGGAPPPVLPEPPEPPSPAPTAPPRPAAAAPPPLPTPKWGGHTMCPSCAKPMSPTETADSLVCASCGRITRLPGAKPLATPAPSAAIGSREPRRTAPDLRSQEMIAAYVAARPIPCPKCHTQLRHRGFAEFGCPSCGATVRFSDPPPTGPGAPSSPTPAGPPALRVSVRRPDR